MKFITPLLICLIFSQVISAQNKVMVTAHRGDWRNAPENSVRAFKSAAAMGVDIVELDLKKTKDGEIVIMHDETINRTTDGKGKPSDYTFEEIRKFRLKNGLGRPTAYNQIPTLKEVMLALKGTGVKVNLDKSWPYYHEAYAILKQTGTLKQAIFKSELPYDSLKAKYPELIDSIIYMPVVNLDKPDAKKIITDYLKNMKPFGFELIFKQDTSAILNDNRFITKTGSKVWINSLWASLNAGHDDDLAVEENNKKDSWDWIIAHGATVIQTDRPQLLLDYLRKKGLHK
ncbi:glycerophosphodiester phosphodiesterase family protein [Mucilaginibacter sp. KACC 22063]|uniref:glycerophosphodiester phosphodiesterase family protein n=1 Tax=Mucilaginibacter sp. KACC 22063 TaxID=3025666 RepID=UPI002366BA63|nr:glycerophosphodiester phosphodiesterase family protein [Mucilaginibacter sp. KACC 22063]WDF56452.1 glycerophosphodiester phosphodiesterase family protein [Mucilaginibacter sp. KACC 22063]